MAHDRLGPFDVLDLLQDLQARRALSYLLITHDVEVVAAMAHEVIVMKAGEIVEHGEVDRADRLELGAGPAAEQRTETERIAGSEIDALAGRAGQAAAGASRGRTRSTTSPGTASAQGGRSGMIGMELTPVAKMTWRGFRMRSVPSARTPTRCSPRCSSSSSRRMPTLRRSGR
mgnify:CR=1 FL=1